MTRDTAGGDVAGSATAADRELEVVATAAELIDLRVPLGNRLERLEGDRRGQHSIRIDDQWRICFRWAAGNADDVEIVDHHAEDISVPPRRINEIVHGKRAVTADTALRLARYYGTTPRSWLNLQAQYDLDIRADHLGDRLDHEVTRLRTGLRRDQRGRGVTVVAAPPRRCRGPGTPLLGASHTNVRMRTMDGPPFEVIAPSAAAAPILVHVPHSSTLVPADVRADLLLDAEELDTELLRLTDHRTDVLASGVGEFGAVRFVNRRSRLVVDPERFPDDTEEMLEVGMGAVYTHGHRRQLIRDISDTDREALLGRYFRPYAAALDAEVTRLVGVHGACTVIDVHSFPSQRLPYELHDGPRPPLCIGTDEFHTPDWLRDLVRDRAEEHGLEVAFDTPFAGTYVPLDRYRSDPRVTAVMLEIRRDTYLDEATAAPHGGEVAVRSFVDAVVAAVVTRDGA
jgi:N-formylglutamate deformylase